jgi:hypothetical protein
VIEVLGRRQFDYVEYSDTLLHRGDLDTCRAAELAT